MTMSTKEMACFAVIAGLLLVYYPQGRLGGAQKSNGAEHDRGITEVTTRFTGTMSLPRTKGPATPLRVELKEWHLAGQDVPIEMHDQGFYIAYLAWGNVSTEIGGTTTVRKPGDFWTVDKGARMVVTIKKPGEEALIQAFLVNPGP